MTATTPPHPTAPRLTVNFVGEVYRPSHELTFGREADLVLDENSFLHRRAGRFRLRDRSWWLDNVGTRLRITVVGNDGSVVDLQPGASTPLLGRQGEISVTAGPVRYVLEYELQEVQAQFQDSGQLTEGPDGDITMSYGPLLTPRELDFVVVLARGRLTGRLGPLPSHGEIADTWGVSHKTVDNTLQRLRSKLRNQRISGIQSTENLVEYLVSQGLVTLSDLEWASLDGPDGPRPAADRPD